MLRALDAVALQIAVSAGVLATLAARRLAAGRAPPGWMALPAGVVAGALTTSTTTAGPPVIVYLLGRAIEPARVRDTMTVVFLGLSVVGVIALLGDRHARRGAGRRRWSRPRPVVVAGHLAGRPLFARLERSGNYEPVLTGALLVAGRRGLATALL